MPEVCFFYSNALTLSVSWLPVSTSAKPLEAPAKTPGVIPSPLTGVCSGVPIHSAGFPARGLFPVFPACWFRELRLSPNCSRRVLQLGPNLARYTATVLLRAPSSVNPPPDGSVLSATRRGIARQLELRPYLGVHPSLRADSAPPDHILTTSTTSSVRELGLSRRQTWG